MTARYRCKTCKAYDLDWDAVQNHWLGNPDHEVIVYDS